MAQTVSVQQNRDCFRIIELEWLGLRTIIRFINIYIFKDKNKWQKNGNMHHAVTKFDRPQTENMQDSLAASRSQEWVEVFDVGLDVEIN